MNSGIAAVFGIIAILLVPSVTVTGTSSPKSQLSATIIASVNHGRVPLSTSIEASVNGRGWKPPFTYVLKFGDLSKDYVVRTNSTKITIPHKYLVGGTFNASVSIQDSRDQNASSSTDIYAKETLVWIWMDWSTVLTKIKSHKASLTTVSPATYYLSNSGTFTLNSGAQQVCAQVHSIGLQCVPMIGNDQSHPYGINKLLTSTSLQSAFIKTAVKTALTKNLDGYNVDFEPSRGTKQVAVAFGRFLTNFGNAMHAVNKTLSVDVAGWDGGALWNYTIEGKSAVDSVLTMQTYPKSMTTFKNTLTTMLRADPLHKIAIGLLTGADDSTLGQRFSIMENDNIGCAMVWPNNSNFLTQVYWDNFTSFLNS